MGDIYGFSVMGQVQSAVCSRDIARVYRDRDRAAEKDIWHLALCVGGLSVLCENPTGFAWDWRTYVDKSNICERHGVEPDEEGETRGRSRSDQQI